MKVSELIGAQLDYWVARAEELKIDATYNTPHWCGNLIVFIEDEWVDYSPSTDWAQGGPLILKTGGVDEWCRNGVLEDTYWQAPPGYDVPNPSEGDTPLQAICRAVVLAKFGDEVEEIGVTE